jgi:hypothetical protein
MSEEQPVRSTAIRELEIEIDPIHALACESYLKEKGCTMAYKSTGFYVVLFPPGTVEEQYAGRGGLYTQETTIKLPNGTMFRTIKASPVNGVGRVRVSMYFPNEILDGA